jgi:hypothetical protein
MQQPGVVPSRCFAHYLIAEMRTGEFFNHTGTGLGAA